MLHSILGYPEDEKEFKYHGTCVISLKCRILKRRSYRSRDRKVVTRGWGWGVWVDRKMLATGQELSVR